MDGCPDVVIYLKTSPNVAKKRIDLRSRDGETIPLEYLSCINNLYDKLYKNSNLDNIRIFQVDANNVISDNFEKIMDIIRKL